MSLLLAFLQVTMTTGKEVMVMKYEQPNLQIIILGDDIICTSSVEHIEDPFKDMESW